MKIGNSSYEIKEIGREYNDDMLKILSDNPIESGGLELCFDRQPDIFKMAEIKYKPARYVGFLKDDKLIGFGLAGYHKAFVNGQVENVFHMTDLYVRKSARNKGFFFKASILLFKEAYKKQNWGYSVIMKGNKNAESHIGRQHKRFPFIPASKVVATLDVRSIVITFKKKEDKSYVIRKADKHDIDSIIKMLQQEYSQRLFAPSINRTVFDQNLLNRPDFSIDNYYIAEKDKKIVGVCAAWNCMSFKQTRVLKYSNQFVFTKIIFSFLSSVFKLSLLPKTGEEFKEIYITDLAIKERNPQILKALLLRIHNDFKALKFNTLIVGSYESDELLNAVKGFLNQSVKSHIVVSSYDEKLLTKITEENSRPLIDVALL